MKSFLFFGSDLFSVRCLEAFRRGLLKKGVKFEIDLVAVKGSVFGQQAASLYNLQYVSGMKDFELKKRYNKALVASFGYFIPPRLIRSFDYCLNVHPSLLPEYRGPSPIQTAIRDRQQVTGVSIIDLHPTIMDGGDIYKQQSLTIDSHEMFNDLAPRLAEIGGELLASVVIDIESVVKRPQQCQEQQYTKKVYKQDGRIIFGEQSSTEIYALYRAISHQVPLFCSTLNGHHVVFKNIVDQNSNSPLNYNDKSKWNTLTVPPGTVFLERPTRALWVKSRSGWISCNSFHLATSPITLDGCQIMSALHGKSMLQLFTS